MEAFAAVISAPDTRCEDGRTTTVAAFQFVVGVSDGILYAASHREAFSAGFKGSNVAGVGAGTRVDIGGGMTQDGARRGGADDGR